VLSFLFGKHKTPLIGQRSTISSKVPSSPLAASLMSQKEPAAVARHLLPNGATNRLLLTFFPPFCRKDGKTVGIVAKFRRPLMKLLIDSAIYGGRRQLIESQQGPQWAGCSTMDRPAVQDIGSGG
jgi:hypothetical protein